jgi:hypothetical protein
MCGVLLDRHPAGSFVAVMQAPAQRSSDAKQKTARKRARRDGEDVTGRRAVVILGMHRSGTSALTGVLGLAGAGLPANLMPATPANPRGYFESQLLYELHEEILAEAGVTWQDLLPPPPDWFARSRGAFRRPLQGAARRVRRRTAAVAQGPAHVSARAALGARVPASRWTLLIAVAIRSRSPRRSIANQMEERKATLHWLDHLLRAEHDTRGQQRSVVSYDHLLADWRGTIARIGVDLDLPFPRLSRRTEAEIDEFLSRKLRHHGADRDALIQRGDVAGWVKDAYEWAQRASAGENPGVEVLDAAAEALLGAERAFGPLLAAAELARTRESEEVQKLTRAIDEWRGETRRRDGEIVRLGEELRGAETQLSIRAGDVDRLREELALRQHHLERIVDWVKVLLQWTAQVTTGRAAPPQSLDVVFRALDTAAPAQLPAVATTGLEVAVHAAEAASLREQLAAVMAESKERAEIAGAMQSEAASLREQLAAVVAESKERAEIAGVLQTEAASLREQLAAVMAGSTRQAELIETLRVECDAFRADAAESRLRAAAIAELQAECESLRPQVAGLEEKVAARTREMVRIDQESARLRADLEIARERLKHEVAARAELEQRTESLRGQATVFARARGEIADRDLYIAKVKARLDEVERSLTWRAGRPFRALARTAKRILGR